MCDDTIVDEYARLLAAGVLNEGEDDATCCVSAASGCPLAPNGLRVAASRAIPARVEAYPVSDDTTATDQHSPRKIILDLSAMTSKNVAAIAQPKLESELGRECALKVAIDEVLYVSSEPTEGSTEMFLGSELARRCAASLDDHTVAPSAVEDESEAPQMHKVIESRAEISYEPMARWTAMARQFRQPRGSKSVEHLRNLRLSDPCYRSLRPSVDRPAPHEVSYDLVKRWNAMARYFRLPRGSKSVEHLEVLRQSDPAYGSLLPSRDRPSAHEISYDPMARWAAMAPLVDCPRGAKTVGHLRALRQSDPSYGSLLPSRDRPAAHELSYDPLSRWAAMAPYLHEAKGSKSVEHTRVLRLSDPAYGSLLPSSDRPGPHEHSYDPLKRWAAMAPYLHEAKGSKGVEHTKVLRLSDPAYGSLMPSSDRPGPHEHSYDPLKRWAAMAPYLHEAKGSKGVEHTRVLRLSDPAYGSLLPSSDRPGPHEHSYDPLSRWTAMAPYLHEPKGSKSVEHTKVLRLSDPAYGSLLPSSDRPGPHEHSYDPLKRWAAMAPYLHEPMGSKSVEHTKVLRLSDPAYGSLMPSSDRPGPHEHSYDPLSRWTAMAPYLHEPKGSKSVEHLKVLRLSDPAYGSLLPSRDRPGPHEHSYDPLARWAAMAPYLHEPKGSKSADDLALLRQSDPAYGSLLPSVDRPGPQEHSYDPLKRWVAMAPHLDVPRGVKPLEHLRALRCMSRPPAEVQLSDLGQEARNTLRRMPRVASIGSFMDDDELPELPEHWSRRRFAEGYESDDASERSAARTMERFSNDTISSLDDSWPASPMVLSGKKPLPAAPLPAFQMPPAHVRWR